MSDQIKIPPVSSNGVEPASSNNPFRKSMDVGTSNPTTSNTEINPDQATKSPAQTSSISPLLAQIGVDPVTGIETTLSLFAFTAENEDELSFPANELIRIVEKDQEYNDGWYRGKNQKGEEGLFPASYVLPTGADPKPYLEMQQAPQPLNISNSKSGPGTPVGETAAGAGEGIAGPTGLGIGGVVTEAKTEAPRPDSPVKSLSRPRSTLSLQSQDSGRVQIPPVNDVHVNGQDKREEVQTKGQHEQEDERESGRELVETREQASKGEIQGPHAQASEMVSPAEQAAARMDVAEDSTPVSKIGSAAGTGAVATGAGLVAGVAGLAIVGGGREKEEDRRLDRDATPMPEDGDRTITEDRLHDRDTSSVGHGDDTFDMDDEAPSTHGETNDNNNIRARLAEQARLENEKKERSRADEEAAERDAEARKRAASDASVGFASPGASAAKPDVEGTPADTPRQQSNGNKRVSGVRMSSGVPHGLVYSDESDSEDEGSVAGGLGSPKKGFNRRLGWEDDEEQTGKGFARFGALGAGKTAEPARRLDQIQEKDKVETPVDTRAGLEPSAPIIAPVAVRPAETQMAEFVEPAPVEPVSRAPVGSVAQAPVESASRVFVPPYADPREESPMGTPIVQLNEDRGAAYQSPPAPVFRRQSSGLSNLSRETPVVAAIPKSVSPVPQQQQQQQVQPVLTRKYSEEMATPRSGAVTPKDVSRMSEAGSGFSGGNPHEWGVTEVVEWARSRGFDDAICEKFAGKSAFVPSSAFGLSANSLSAIRQNTRLLGTCFLNSMRTCSKSWKFLNSASGSRSPMRSPT